MLYTDYKISRDLAWEILINEKVKELPVKVSEICDHMGIKIKPEEQGKSGHCEYIDGAPVIFCNRSEPIKRQRFTVAHELGHVLMRHTDKYGVMYRDPAPTDDPKEQAVNVFAARLLAPAIVLRDLGVTNADQIAEICQISQTAAEYRMQRLQILYDREKRFLTERGYSCFGLSPLEREVERQFKRYIRKHRL